jgi:hypothetical protein
LTSTGIEDAHEGIARTALLNGEQAMARSGKGMPRKPATKFPNLRKKMQKVRNQTRQAKKK